MSIIIGEFEFSEVWNGVLYKKLSDYPRITDWEMRTLLEFAAYERQHGRACSIECADENLRRTIDDGFQHPECYLDARRPDLLTECTACPVRKGCETMFVCHTSSVENAVSILKDGALRSAKQVRNVPVEVLVNESRNAARDPADYFDYVMFAWGNCQAGDRLVMERALGRFPTEQELNEQFRPGVRFYFRYDTLARHPNRVFDGVLPMRVKNEVRLAEWVYRIVLPADERSRLAPYIPPELADRIICVKNDGLDLWRWTEKVYAAIEQTTKEELRI